MIIIKIRIVREMCGSLQLEIHYPGEVAVEEYRCFIESAGLEPTSVLINDSGELVQKVAAKLGVYDEEQLIKALAHSVWDLLNIGRTVGIIQADLETGGPLDLTVDPFEGETATITRLIIRRKEDVDDLQLRLTLDGEGDLRHLVGIEGLVLQEGTALRPIYKVTSDIDQNSLCEALIRLGMKSAEAGKYSARIYAAAQTEKAYESIWAKVT